MGKPEQNGTNHYKYMIYKEIMMGKLVTHHSSLTLINQLLMMRKFPMKDRTAAHHGGGFFLLFGDGTLQPARC
jgi:hypothetical protein